MDRNDPPAGTADPIEYPENKIIIVDAGISKVCSRERCVPNLLPTQVPT